MSKNREYIADQVERAIDFIADEKSSTEAMRPVVGRWSETQRAWSRGVQMMLDGLEAAAGLLRREVREMDAGSEGGTTAENVVPDDIWLMCPKCKGKWPQSEASGWCENARAMDGSCDFDGGLLVLRRVGGTRTATDRVDALRQAFQAGHEAGYKLAGTGAPHGIAGPRAAAFDRWLAERAGGQR